MSQLYHGTVREWEWSDIRNLCSAFNPSFNCAHTQQWTHTRSSGQPFLLRHPGSSWGFGAFAQGHLSRGIEGGESTVHSLHLQFRPAWDSNSQPLGYESDSLTIRPQLPHHMGTPYPHPYGVPICTPYGYSWDKNAPHVYELIVENTNYLWLL